MAKFRGVRKFLRNNVDALMSYVSIDLNLALSDLFTNLSRLNFTDNFDGEVVIATLAASGETAIPHTLGTIPSGKIILRDFNCDIRDGSTAWTNDTIYLDNNTATEISATILILR